MRPSQQMRDLGVVQYCAPGLGEPARPFALPDERQTADTVVSRLLDAMERIRHAHDFSGKGLGVAVLQIGIPRSAAVIQPPGADPIVLLNPRITVATEETDEKFEGCLSFFDVRGLVPRPLRITVETTTLEGQAVTTIYERGIARLVHHEIDHLNGVLYTARMRAGVAPISVDEYRQTGRAWAYEQ